MSDEQQIIELLRQGRVAPGIALKRSQEWYKPDCLLCRESVPIGQDYIGLLDDPDFAVCYDCGNRHHTSHQLTWVQHEPPHGVLVPVEMIPPHLRGRV